ncbi:hypothetical protein [Natrarchaeobius chitinivorans]|uniref:Uncharacterized protein n=1 Tax=Natrarchaeobius chitinivorans TaxID=1679083 RepID=A0A3N6M7J2_NATCH|nr:hypothetical protein [Natrarchaeobius chitinivorans]RQG89346.1 hypothetical protein EA473_22330 [Natrarchaeobius chitinivorans]
MSDEFLALEAQREALERQTEALEAIATEMRYQNAVLVEMVSCLDDLSARVDENHFPETEPVDRSGPALQTWIQDRLYERDQLEGDQPSFRWGQPENWQDANQRGER